MKKYAAGVLILGCAFLAGCKTDEEKLIGSCIDGLEQSLAKRAKHDGWSVNNAKGLLISMNPDTERNAKYGTEQFWLFEVIVSDFTVKNGLNVEVKSFSSCKGYVSKDVNGKFEAPELANLSFTLNDEKLKN